MPSIIDQLMGAVSSVNPFAPQHEPLYPQLPTNETRLANKYTTMAPYLANVPAPLVNSLIDLDTTRVSTGSQPYTVEDTIKALKAAQTHAPVTPPSTRSVFNLPGNALRDLSDIVTSIPRIPRALVQTAQHPTIDNVSALIPGVYTAKNLLAGPSGWKEAVTHPLMTGLDVLPAADWAAGTTEVGRAAEAAAREAGTRARPIAALATKTLDEEGNLVPNAFGAKLHELRITTKPGQLYDKFANRDVWRRMEEGRFGIQAAQRGLMEQGVPEGLAHETATIVPRWAESIPELADPAYRADLTQRMASGDAHLLNDKEMGLKGEVDDINRRIAEYGTKQENPWQYILDGEVYGAEEGKQLRMSAIKRDTTTRFNAIRQSLTGDVAPIDPDAVVQRLSTVLSTPRPAGPLRTHAERIASDARGELSRRMAKQEAKGLIFQLDRGGYDVTALRKSYERASRTGEWSTLERQVSEGFPLKPSPLPDVKQITDVLDHYARRGPGTTGDVSAGVLSRAIKDRNWKGVTRQLESLTARYGPSSLPEFTTGTMLQDIRRIRDIGKYADNLPNDAQAARASATHDALVQRTVPRRFHDVVKGETNRRYAQLVNVSSADVERLATRSIREWAADPAFDLNAYKDIQREVAASWQQLRDDGLDPTFIHTVTPGMASSIFHPRIAEVPTKISAAQTVSLDMTPGLQDFSVALNHQAVEILSRHASEAWAEYVAGAHGVSEADLVESYRARADQLAITDPRKTFDGHLEELMRKGYAPFNTGDYGWSSPRLTAIDQQRVWIPKSLSESISSLHNPKSPLTAALDPFTRAFRFSVIGLSPRVHLYSILGGAVMVGGEGGLGTFKYVGEALKMMKDPSSIGNDTLRAQLGIGSMKESFLDDLRRDVHGKLSPAHADIAVKYTTGSMLRRIWDQVQDSKVAGGVKKVAEKSLEINGYFDDTYRAMAYLRGRELGIKRGAVAGSEAAEHAGIELSRRALMDWSALTPLERNLLKPIFPFYGFIQHSLAYVMRYPVDHPLRAHFVAALARNQLDELNDVMPARFLSMLPVGKMDKNGRQGFLNLAAANPFNDVANMFTLAGFLRSTNPVFSTILESVGLNQGTADLYPNVRYDPQTGRLSVANPNPLMTLLGNTIPQSQIFTNLLGASSDFNDLLRRDSSGALRSLAAAGGVPVAWRGINVPQEEYRSELARIQADADTQRGALSSGNYGAAQRHPLVDAYLKQVATLPPSVTQPFTPQDRTQEMLREKIRAGMAATGGI